MVTLSIVTGTNLSLFLFQLYGFEHIKLPAKVTVLDYFLRSNKSNINQIRNERNTAKHTRK